MTYLASTTDNNSLFSQDSDRESSLFQPRPSDETNSSIYKHRSEYDITSLDAPKAIFLNTSIPVSFDKHCIQLHSDDGSFRTILKEDPLATVDDITRTLRKKFGFRDITIVLQDDVNSIKRAFDKDDRIIKIQNSLFRSLWIDETELANATLKYPHSFKFLIRKT